MLNLSVFGVDKVRTSCLIGETRCEEVHLVKSNQINLNNLCFRRLLQYHNSFTLKKTTKWTSSGNYSWSLSYADAVEYYKYHSNVTKEQLIELGQERKLTLPNLKHGSTLDSIRTHPNGGQIDSLYIGKVDELFLNKGQTIQVRQLKVGKVTNIINFLSYFDLQYLDELNIGTITDNESLTPSEVELVYRYTFRPRKLKIKHGNAARFVLSYDVRPKILDIEHFIPFPVTLGLEKSRTLSNAQKIREEEFIRKARQSGDSGSYFVYYYPMKNKSQEAGILFPRRSITDSYSTKEGRIVKVTNCVSPKEIQQLRIRGVCHAGFKGIGHCDLEKLTLGPRSVTFDDIFTDRAKHLVIEVSVESDGLVYNNTELELDGDRKSTIEYLLVKSKSKP